MLTFQVLQQSWQRAWTALGVSPDATLFHRLVTCYTEPHRRYHTLQHLLECIQTLEPLLTLSDHPGEVEVAVWFHDAVYEVQRHDNEMQSAIWAKQAVLTSGAAAAIAGRIEALILATQHAVPPVSMDECLLIDVDLAILGASPERFEEYECQIREEYEWVPPTLFQRQRQAILLAFLNRPFIFSTKAFRDQFESQARQNLQRSIARLAD